MNAAGFSLLKEFEGRRLEAYQDVVGVWTIGYGHTKDVQPGQTITEQQAETLLLEEVREYERAVLSSCSVPPNENQLSAMTSLCYNIGKAGFMRSSVLSAHNRGDFQSAARAFALWNMAGGKVWPGLTRRRAAEAALYMKPVVDDYAMPQAVDPERGMGKSNIARAGTITAATSGLAAAADMATSFSIIKHAFGEWLPYVITVALVVAAVAGVWILIERILQRRKGWA